MNSEDDKLETVDFGVLGFAEVIEVAEINTIHSTSMGEEFT